MRVAVLALQGDFEAHARALRCIGAEPELARAPADLAATDALVLPGGESTAMLRGLERGGLEPAIQRFLASGRPVLGTCAGAVLLARKVRGTAQPSFGALDIDIERNAYGTQLDSFVCRAETDDSGSVFSGLECVLIRAPRIVRVGADVTVHVRVKGDPALVSSANVWVTTFHPELTRDTRVQLEWLRSAAFRG